MSALQSLFVLFCILNSVLAYSQDEASYLVKKLEIEGLSKTKRNVIETELGFREGDRITDAVLEEGITRLRNTNLFVNIKSEVTGDESSKVIRLHLEDRWTTIPIAKFSSGGGVTQLILGVYDPNIAGRYLEAGAQYERLGGTDSGVLWLRDRRLWDTYFYLDFQYWSINRLRTKYIQEALDPEIKAGFLHKREKLYFGLIYDFGKWLRAGFSFEQHTDEFSDQYVSDEVKEERIDDSIPPDTKFNLYGIHAEFGRLDYNNYLVDGLSMMLDWRRALSEESFAKDFNQYDFNVTYFKTLPGNITFGQRFKVGVTNTNTIQYWYYLGGLDSVRGFADNRFAGRDMWLSNTELRYPFYDSENIVLQAVGFYDAVATAEKQEDLNAATGASIGGGIRVIAPKIYRLVGRLDFASPLVRRDEKSVSFGVQQFF